jgi:hypothetical protein
MDASAKIVGIARKCECHKAVEAIMPHYNQSNFGAPESRSRQPRAFWKPDFPDEHVSICGAAEMLR